MTSPQEALQKARELISDPKRWTTGDFSSLREDGTPCFCAIGALAHVSDVSPFTNVPGEDELSDAIWEQYGEPGIAEFNDSHTHAEVLAAFDLAIARASSSSEENP